MSKRCLFCLLLVLCASSASQADEFACPDEQSKRLAETLREASREFRDEDTDDQYVEVVKALIAEATRPEDAKVAADACQALVRRFSDEQLQGERSDDLAVCPRDLVDRFVAEKDALWEVLGNKPGAFIVKIAPTYPPKAVKQELSGEVIVEFTVTADGRVKKPQVVESTDKVFEKASLAAIKKFKYARRMENGEAVATEGVRHRFVYDYEAFAFAQKYWACPR